MSKIQDIQAALNQKYYEREGEVEALLTAMLSKQHVLFIGDAGTGKSQLSSELGNIVQGSNYFQWLLSQFSTPEELFGVLSLKELEQGGVYKRNTSHKLPEAHFGFLDEIFKANSAILNSLLTIINERLFYNNGSPVQTPLMSIVGSSNEYPEEGEGLEALFDRFLLRYEVDYIKEEKAFISLLKGDNNVQIPTITLDELKQYQSEVAQIIIPDNAINTLATIRTELKDEGIRPSDRRFKQSLSLLQAKAFIDQRTQVVLKDLGLLSNTLWETPEQRNTVRDIVYDHCSDVNEVKFEQLKQNANELIELLHSDIAKDELEIMKKLKALADEVAKIQLDDATKQQQFVDYLKNTRDEYATKQLGIF
ncbi:MoxR-like ATPase [Gracilibacillus boraciitolerans JCM 21714]|uniref:MoxR-like ATPase n=1 Tax=Gracilibacillus boraciitolerans JCM 21714 TaxID=1298598 RepID=W4VJT9_9BACI|nr:AAA family ATPase [Gracilibacillus boraciitolerans]GAE93034.1 MoxR-like ATPase [Gracilibacillus boraciitolerans JCM 21714]